MTACLIHLSRLELDLDRLSYRFQVERCRARSLWPSGVGLQNCTYTGH